MDFSELDMKSEQLIIDFPKKKNPISEKPKYNQNSYAIKVYKI